MERKKEEVGSCFEQKSIGERQEFREMKVSRYLSCRAGGFLVGDAM